MTEKSNARSAGTAESHNGPTGHDFVNAIMWAHLAEVLDVIVAHSKSQPPPCHLIYADGELQIGLDHPTWAKQCIYVIMANCEEKPILYIGKAGSTFDRLSPIAKSNSLGHERVKEAGQSLHQVAVFSLEVESLNVETPLIKHFDPVMNRSDAPHWQREKQRRRVEQIMTKIEQCPGIAFSSAIFGFGHDTGTAIVNELVTTGQIHRRDEISDKNGKPCRYLYPAKAASMQHRVAR